MTTTIPTLLKQLGRRPTLGRFNVGARVAVDRLALPIPNLPPSLEGIRIVQISDLHLYPYIQVNYLRKALAQATELQPDLLVLTGDYVTLDADAIFELAPLLGRLNARHGVYAVLGNHDLWTNRRAVVAGFAEAGLPLLVNQTVPITAGAGTLYLAGLDDGWSGQPDLNAALQDVPGDAPAVLLVHEPDLIDEYAQDPRIALQLSGHSHGGQVRFGGMPPRFLPYLGRKYVQGLHRVNHTWLYTNRGLGYTTVPVRINCPPEITEITLTR